MIVEYSTSSGPKSLSYIFDVMFSSLNFKFRYVICVGREEALRTSVRVMSMSLRSRGKRVSNLELRIMLGRPKVEACRASSMRIAAQHRRRCSVSTGSRSRLRPSLWQPTPVARFAVKPNRGQHSSILSTEYAYPKVRVPGRKKEKRGKGIVCNSPSRAQLIPPSFE